MPKVSVIVPVYNTEKYLEKCITSLTGQTLQDIEIILINDGSTDGSLEILNRFAEKDSRIKIIDKKNEGYGKAINIGIEKAESEYVGIVDSDDYVSESMYMALYKAAVQNDADIIRSNFYEVKGENDAIKKKKIVFADNPIEYNTPLDPLVNREVFYFKTMNIWTGLYRKDMILQHGIKANESPGASFQDNGFWFQTMIVAKRVVFLNDFFYHYRKDNPLSSIRDKNKVNTIFGEYGFIKDFLISNPGIYNNFFDVYVKQKYYVYSDHYNRVQHKDKIGFLRRVADEFRDDLAELGKGCDNLDNDVLGQMARIIDSPEIYYYESSVDILNKKYNIIKKAGKEISDSLEYRKMQKVKNMIKVIKKMLRR